MKVLFISNDPSIFDVKSSTYARMQTYAAAIGELHILSYSRSLRADTEFGPLKLHPLTGNKILAMMRMSGIAKRIIRAYGIEVVSAQDPFEYGWIALQAVKGTSARLHLQVHADALSPWFVTAKEFRAPKARVPLGNRIRRKIMDLVLPNADGIRVMSNRIKASLIETYGERIVVPNVIPIFVDETTEAPATLPEHSFSFALLTVGRLEPEKRIQDILYALARIQQRYPSVGLFICGNGSERKYLETLRDKLGLTSKVIFLGERTDVRGLMKSVHAYIQASAYEGYGRTLIEAALARIPIITTDVGIVGEVFSGYEDVLSAPVGDPAALAVHIAGIVDDHQARISLSMNAELKARAHLSEGKNTPEYIAKDLSETLRSAYPHQNHG